MESESPNRKALLIDLQQKYEGHGVSRKLDSMMQKLSVYREKYTGNRIPNWLKLQKI